MEDKVNNKIESGTIARTVVLVLALFNQSLTAMGKNPLPFAEESVYELVTLVLTIGASIAAGWKNNSFTQAAIQADQTLKQLKGGN